MVPPDVIPFCLVLRPEEAAAAVMDWPRHAWLVVFSTQSGARWEAVEPSRLTEALSGYDVWPPLGGMKVAVIDPWEEISLLDRIVAQPGLGTAAKKRLEQGCHDPCRDISPDDVDW